MYCRTNVKKTQHNINYIKINTNKLKFVNMSIKREAD